MRFAFLLIGLLAACGPIPRDPDGTFDRVRAKRVFTVGVVGAGLDGRARSLVEEVSRDAGARPALRTGQLEPLLLALEKGQVDLVVGGRFDPDTPWATRVTLSAPLDRKDRDGAQAFAATRNGENAWIILVDRAAKRIGTAR